MTLEIFLDKKQMLSEAFVFLNIYENNMSSFIVVGKARGSTKAFLISTCFCLYLKKERGQAEFESFCFFPSAVP